MRKMSQRRPRSRRIDSRSGESVDEPAAVERDAVPAPADRVLALQRGAGNTAVGRWLADRVSVARQKRTGAGARATAARRLFVPPPPGAGFDLPPAELRDHDSPVVRWAGRWIGGTVMSEVRATHPGAEIQRAEAPSHILAGDGWYEQAYWYKCDEDPEDHEIVLQVHVTREGAETRFHAAAYEADLAGGPLVFARLEGRWHGSEIREAPHPHEPPLHQRRHPLSWDEDEEDLV